MKVRKSARLRAVAAYCRTRHFRYRTPFYGWGVDSKQLAERIVSLLPGRPS